MAAAAPTLSSDLFSFISSSFFWGKRPFVSPHVALCLPVRTKTAKTPITIEDSERISKIAHRPAHQLFGVDGVVSRSGFAEARDRLKMECRVIDAWSRATDSTGSFQSSIQTVRFIQNAFLNDVAVGPKHLPFFEGFPTEPVSPVIPKLISKSMSESIRVLNWFRFAQFNSNKQKASSWSNSSLTPARQAG